MRLSETSARKEFESYPASLEETQSLIQKGCAEIPFLEEPREEQEEPARARGYVVSVSILEGDDDMEFAVGTKTEAQDEAFEWPHGWGREGGKEEPGIRQECAAALEARKLSELGSPAKRSGPRLGV